MTNCEFLNLQWTVQIHLIGYKMDKNLQRISGQEYFREFYNLLLNISGTKKKAKSSE